MTSVCYPHVKNHTTIKSQDMLALHNYLSLAHGGAFLFIDAVDPIGTQNTEVYEKMGNIFSESKTYEAYLSGDVYQNVAIYFSFKSKYDSQSDPSSPAEALSHTAIKMINSDLTFGDIQKKSIYPHLNAALGAARVLKENHIPFGVISRGNLDKLNQKVLVLPGVLELDEEEEARIKQYVNNGGSLYVSGNPSSTLLKEMAGLDVIGETVENITYIRPLEKGRRLMSGVDPEYPLSIFNKQYKVKTMDAERVLAVTMLPYTDPRNVETFASIHSNPPGVVTEDPALVCAPYGQGKVIWASASLEQEDLNQHKDTFLQLIRELAGGEFLIEMEAPACVEVVTLHDMENNRFVISIVNVQEALPPIPVFNIQIKLKLGGRRLNQVRYLSANEDMSYKEQDGNVIINIENLDIFGMIVVDHDPLGK